jgi:hypothetical protein
MKAGMRMKLKTVLRMREWGRSRGWMMELLEGRMETISGKLDSEDISHTLWSYAGMGKKPGERLMVLLERRMETISGEFSSQNVSDTLWTYSRMGRMPGERLMGLLEERVEAISGDFDLQDVSDTLLAYATMGRMPGERLILLLEDGRRRHCCILNTHCGRMQRWGGCRGNV